MAPNAHWDETNLKDYISTASNAAFFLVMLTAEGPEAWTIISQSRDNIMESVEKAIDTWHIDKCRGQVYRYGTLKEKTCSTECLLTLFKMNRKRVAVPWYCHPFPAGFPSSIVTFSYCHPFSVLVTTGNVNLQIARPVIVAR